MSYLFNFLIGILIGAGAIIPGISSGVFCVIFGIYEKIVNSITNLFKDLKNNLLFLVPILLGAVVGIILFGKILKYFFFTFKMQACFAFIGFILGTLPALLTKASNSQIICIKKIIPMVVTFTIGLLLTIFENKYRMNNTSNLSFSVLYLIFAGFIMSIGIIVPGVSNTVLLMCLGVYPTYLNAMSSVNLTILTPIAIGIFLGSILWLKIVSYLLANYHEITLYSIIGFAAGSIFILYPGLSFNVQGLISIMCLVISTIISYKLSSIENSHKL